MKKSLIRLTSAMNNARIILEADDVKGIQDVEGDNQKGNTKVFTSSCGNFYVNEFTNEVEAAKEKSLGIWEGNNG